MIKDKGFSLIEMLVALAILSMVILIASLGYKFFMERWISDKNQFETITKNAKKILLTQDAITGMYPYVLNDHLGKPVIYFEGNRDSVVGVTGHAMFGQGDFAVCRISIEQNEDFTYSIVYEEHVLNKIPLVTLKQKISYEHRLVLISNIKDPEFYYFGYKDSDTKANNGEMQWWDSFNAVSRKIMPNTVRLSFLIGDSRQDLDFPINQLDNRVLAQFGDDKI